MDNLWIKILDGELFIVKRPTVSTFQNQPVKTNNKNLQIIIWTEI